MTNDALPFLSELAWEFMTQMEQALCVRSHIVWPSRFRIVWLVRANTAQCFETGVRIGSSVTL